LNVAQVMRKIVVIIPEEASVTEASKNMREKQQPCAIVLKNQIPFGIITERDIAWKVVANSLDPKTVKIKDIMSTPLIVIDPDADLIEAASLMKDHKIRRLAVVRANTLLGIITAGDIMRNLSNYVEKEVQDVLRYLWVPKYYPDVM